MLAEWHISPEYILENWTDEQLESFWVARNQRVLETDRAFARAREEQGQSQDSGSRKVTDAELFAAMGLATGQA
jgi:hypothetical protein